MIKKDAVTIFDQKATLISVGKTFIRAWEDKEILIESKRHQDQYK